MDELFPGKKKKVDLKLPNIKEKYLWYIEDVMSEMLSCQVQIISA